MTNYAVTGATGPFGAHVVQTLLASGVPAQDITAIVRDNAKATNLTASGVSIRVADYSDQAALAEALSGVEVLLLVSGSEVGQRIAQHTNVINAAVAAGVRRIAYTSVLRAYTTPLLLAPEHKATEEVLRSSGVDYTILRNGWYTENYTGQLANYLERGTIVGATDGGRVAAATRGDYAEAAANVLTGTGHENAVYELGGTPFTMKELADTITAVTGTEVTVTDVEVSELVDVLKGAGLDEGTATFVAALDEATARGDLDTDSKDLATLLGRPTTTLEAAVRAA